MSIKWIFALVTFAMTRSVRMGILGFVVGYVVELLVGNKGKVAVESSGRGYYRQETDNSFEVNLITLCAIIIKADGRIDQRELGYVKSQFVHLYGVEKANDIFRTFNEQMKVNASLPEVCGRIRMVTSYETRVQILHMLFGVANSDGNVSDSEVYKILEASGYLGVHSDDFERVKAMFQGVGEDNYKILGVERDASGEEIKKRYRELVMKYHPDRVVTNDEAVKKGAEEKFKKIQDAYEKIKKERGL